MYSSLQDAKHSNKIQLFIYWEPVYKMASCQCYFYLKFLQCFFTSFISIQTLPFLEEISKTKIICLQTKLKQEVMVTAASGWAKKSWIMNLCASTSREPLSHEPWSDYWCCMMPSATHESGLSPLWTSTASTTLITISVQNLFSGSLNWPHMPIKQVSFMSV